MAWRLAVIVRETDRRTDRKLDRQTQTQTKFQTLKSNQRSRFACSVTIVWMDISHRFKSICMILVSKEFQNKYIVHDYFVIPWQ